MKHVSYSPLQTSDFISELVTDRPWKPRICATMGDFIKLYPPGWWFGTFFIFPYIGNVIIPNDQYFSDQLKQPSKCCKHPPTWASASPAIRSKELIFELEAGVNVTIGAEVPCRGCMVWWLPYLFLGMMDQFLEVSEKNGGYNPNHPSHETNLVLEDMFGKPI